MGLDFIKIDFWCGNDTKVAKGHAKPISKIDLLQNFKTLGEILKIGTEAIKKSDFYKG